jgi:tripartite-type tricarboxylate transporter receptor subunit TctC
MKKDQTLKGQGFISIFVGLILCLSWGVNSWAQYPAKPINLTVGWGAGGITDVTARALSDAASKILGQPIVVINKPGGGSAVSLAFLKNEKPDGYSIGTLSSGGIITQHLLKAGYDATKDFTPIMGFAENIGGVAVQADSPWKTFKEFVLYAKNNPGKIKYGTPGVGSNHHLAMERLAMQEGIKWVHIPFKGGHPTITALLGGHVGAAACSPDWVPQVKAGTLKLLSVYSSTRMPRFPDVPSWMDLGYNISVKITTSIIGPKGVPSAIVEKLHEAFKRSLDDANFKKALENYDMVVYYQDPQGLAKEINEYSEQWGKLIAQLGLKVE